MDLNHKKILFISASFFNYEKIIAEKLNALGAAVDFYDERPSNSAWVKGVIRVYSPLIQKKIDAYYREILKNTQSVSYDFFLLVKGEAVPFWFLTEFRKLHPQTQMIYISYDTVEEYPKTLKLKAYFDRSYSFEPADAVKYGFIFRPNFYLDTYKDRALKTNFDYDLVFIGSAHTDRYLCGEAVRKAMDDANRKSLFYYYAPNRVFFFLKRIFDKTMQTFDASKLSFKKLSHAEVAGIYDDSFAVLDINKPFQTGLSMRMLDSLAAGKKVITTNPDVVKYPFYNPKNILLIDRRTVEIPRSFFETGFDKMPDLFFEKCAIESWIEAVFLNPPENYWDGVTETYTSPSD